MARSMRAQGHATERRLASVVVRWTTMRWRVTIVRAAGSMRRRRQWRRAKTIRIARGSAPVVRGCIAPIPAATVVIGGRAAAVNAAAIAVAAIPSLRTSPVVVLAAIKATATIVVVSVTMVKIIASTRVVVVVAAAPLRVWIRATNHLAAMWRPATLVLMAQTARWRPGPPIPLITATTTISIPAAAAAAALPATTVSTTSAAVAAATPAIVGTIVRPSSRRRWLVEARHGA